MAQMLTCLSLLLFREYGPKHWGGREGPNVVKTFNTNRAARRRLSAVL